MSYLYLSFLRSRTWKSLLKDIWLLHLPKESVQLVRQSMLYYSHGVQYINWPTTYTLPEGICQQSNNLESYLQVRLLRKDRTIPSKKEMANQFISIDSPVLLRPLKLHAPTFASLWVQLERYIRHPSSSQIREQLAFPQENAMINLMFFYITASILISNTRKQNTNRIKTILTKGEKTKFGPTFYVFYLTTMQCEGGPRSGPEKLSSADDAGSAKRTWVGIGQLCQHQKSIFYTQRIFEKEC